MTPSLSRILAYLETHPGSIFREVAAGAYVSLPWVTKQLCALRKADLIHVSGKRSTDGGAGREYSLGPQQKPVKSLTKDKQHQAKKRREWRLATGLYEARKANRRLAKPDPVMAALLGIRV